MASYGWLEGEYDSGIGVSLYWKVTAQDTVNNTSTIKTELYFYESVEGATDGYLSVHGGVIVDGQESSYSKSIWTDKEEPTAYGWLVSENTFTVDHNSDGSAQIDIVVRGFSSSDIYIDEAVTLPTIQRASTIAATAANIEEGSTIVVTRYVSSFRHSIEWKLGEDGPSGFMREDGSTVDTEHKMIVPQIVFTIPSEMYAQIPNAKSGIVYLTCRTYNGDTLHGTQTIGITVTASPERCAPEVTGEVADINEATIALTGDANTLVRYASTALCTITAQAKNSATIQKKWIQGTEVIEDTLAIAAVETGRFTFDAKDSRGYYNGGAIPNPAVVTKTLVPYVLLTCRAVCQRVDPTSSDAILTITGSYYDGSFGAVNNTLAVKYAIDGGEYVTVAATVQDGTYTAVAEIAGMDYMQSYKIEVVAVDAIATASRAIVLGKSIPVFDWGENDFNFNVPAYAPEFWFWSEDAGGYIKMGLAEGPAGKSAYEYAVEAGYKGTEEEFAAKLAEGSGGGLTRTLLWENASPASAFAAQDVSVACADYDAIEIEFLTTNSTSTFGSTAPGYQTTGWVSYGESKNVLLGDPGYPSRVATLGASAIAFATGKSTATASGTGYCIPFKIYGIKEVQ